mmetsp:Transcript_11894/g.35547  ORF Transcript_11894/g.35547 Transcript_11894/m.35547 type:complete len:209 (-) Transcript_11894:28-654(-)
MPVHRARPCHHSSQGHRRSLCQERAGPRRPCGPACCTRTPGGPTCSCPRPGPFRAPGGSAQHRVGPHGCTLTGVRSRPWGGACRAARAQLRDSAAGAMRHASRERVRLVPPRRAPGLPAHRAPPWHHSSQGHRSRRPLRQRRAHPRRPGGRSFCTRPPGGPTCSRGTPGPFRAASGSAQHLVGPHGCTLTGVRSRPWGSACRDARAQL